MPDQTPIAERIAAGDVVQDAAGHRITLAWPLSVSGAKRITLDYTCASDRAQLLHVAIRGGTTIAHGMTTTAFVVRCSRTSSPVTFEAFPHDEVATLYFWNGWTVAGIDQAWLGNAGIYEQIDQKTLQPTQTASQGAPARHRLACSDGVGAPSFTNLIATITVEERPTADRTERRSG